MMFRCFVISSQFLFAVLVSSILKILLCFLGVHGSSSHAVLIGGWVQEWYLLTSLQVAGQWGPHLYLLTSQPSVPSWLQSPDHAAHTLQPCMWLKVFSTQPVGIIHAEIPAQVSSLLVLLWPPGLDLFLHPLLSALAFCLPYFAFSQWPCPLHTEKTECT